MGELYIDHHDPGSEPDLRSFLEAILSQYEVLVEDMQSELKTKCQETRRLVLNSSHSNPDLASNTDASTDVRDAMIANLQSQLELHMKSEDLLKTLVKLALEQIDLLEMVKPKEAQSTRLSQVHPDVFSRLKEVNDYAVAMKDKCVHLSRQSEVQQKTIAEMKIQYNALLRKIESDHSTEINNLTQVTHAEIHHAKRELQKVEKQFEFQLKRRLNEEKANWEYQESRTLTLLRAQIEELLLELATFTARERDLVVKVEELQMENTMLQGKLRAALSDIVEASIQFKEAFEGSSARNKAKDDPIVNKTSSSATQTEDNQQTIILEDIHSRCKERLQQLESESKKLEESLRQSEAHCSEQAQWLQLRISQLNDLNCSLTEQFREMSEKYDTVCKSKNVKREEKAVQATDVLVEPEKPQEKVTEKGNNEDQGLPLTLEIVRMQAERQELTELLHKQMRIASKWKQEFKDLVKRTKLECS